MNTAQHDEELFARALARPANERAAFVAGVCRDDAALRERILALLAAYSGGDSLLAASPIPRTTIHEERAGDAIGRYKLLQKIGEGGCGVVWMAEQEEPVRRRVALKVIKLGMDTKAVVARFEAERQALAMMDHACIAKVHDAGSTEIGRPYFVMELVRGIPITKYCDENHLTPKERLELFIKVCQAIQHAHQKGVIHRDIKPSNILVTVNDGAPTPKVIDFGIAKATQGKLTDATVFTAFEQFIGTPVYMSPEQAEMSSLDIDTRSDVYSLGVLLYELLTGRPPFDPKTFAQAGVDQIRQQIREREPAKPSRRLGTLDEDEQTTVARLRGTAPAQLSVILRGDLDWVVMRCLEKDRTRRYDTANGLAMDIQRYLRNEPVVARPSSTTYLIQKLIRRHRVGFAAVAIIALVIVLGAAISTWQAVLATRAKRDAMHAQQNEEKLRHAAQAQEFAVRQLAYAADMNLIQQALAINDLGRAQELLNRHRPQPGQRDLRGWEWRYLWQQGQSDAHSVLAKKQYPARSLSVSSDGSWVAIGENFNGGLTVRHLRTGQEFRVPAGNDRVVAVFSPVDPLLAVSGTEPTDTAGGRRGFILIWNLNNQQIDRRLDLPGPWLPSTWTSLSFSRDGQSLVSSSFGPNNAIRIWRMPEGQLLRELTAAQPYFAYWAHTFAASPDMRLIAHHTPALNEIRVIDPATGLEKWKSRSAEELASAMAFSPDGSILASGAGFSESTIRLWNAESGQEIGRLEGHHGWISALVFWPDGGTLASASGDKTIRLWDVSTRRLLRTFRGHKLPVSSLALHPDGRTLVSGARDGSVCVWDTRGRRDSLGSSMLPVPLITWQFAADSRSILALEGDGSVMARSGPGFQQKQFLFRIDGPGIRDQSVVPSNAYVARFSPDSRWLAVGSYSGIVQIWDVTGRSLLRELTSESKEVLPAGFYSGSNRLVVCERSHFRYRDYDLASGRENAWWPGPDAELVSKFGSAISPDGSSYLMIGLGGRAMFRDMRTGAIASFNLDIREPEGPRFSADGAHFASGSQFGTAKMWETRTRREVAAFTNATGDVHSFNFSPDGSRIATSSLGATEAVRLWDFASHQPLLTLPAEGSSFRQAAFSPDGTTVGAVNLAGFLYLWSAPTWEEIEEKEKLAADKPPR